MPLPRPDECILPLDEDTPVEKIIPSGLIKINAHEFITDDNVYVKLTNQTIEEVRTKDMIVDDESDDSIDVPDII
jgi:hypothetical protein